MPAKKKTEKQPSKSKKEKEVVASPNDGSDDSTITPADRLRNEGIVATFAMSSKKMHRNVKDISVDNLTVLLQGTPLVEEAELSLNFGNRYGLIGRNGCGKSTLMRVIGARCIPIPDGIDIFHVREEIEASDMTAKEAVMSVDRERARLEAEAEELNELIITLSEGSEEAEETMDRLNYVYERLEELDAATAETRCAKILSGLGFTPETQNKKTKDFSGGWRMRIALARALFIQPTLLLLDEPTNHLDMEAVVWLEDYLSKWNKILLLVSHSQDFLNNVCTHMIHYTHRKLDYFSGNYDSFVNTRTEQNEEKEKIYKREQDQIKHMKEYIARFGQGNAKMARQAQSKEKVLDKMMRSGLTEKVEVEKSLDFKFPSPSKLPPPVLQCTNITFGYPGCEILYRNVDFGIDLDTRVALVGPNGAGKSTLLKIMTGELIPIAGSVRPHPHLRISKFSQHFIDVLDLTLSPLDYFMTTFDLNREDARKFLGRYGISGPVQTQVMGQLSDGQKSRVVLAKMAKENPHMLFLDEPTNHLDMESIDSLAKAINEFEGGCVLVSHDMRLISQVAKEIWFCDNKTVMKFVGEISDFKMQLRNQMQKNNLIEGDAASSRVPAPVFAPITPATKYSPVDDDIPSVAPVIPPKSSVTLPPKAPPAEAFPSLKSSASSSSSSSSSTNKSNAISSSSSQNNLMANETSNNSEDNNDSNDDNINSGSSSKNNSSSNSSNNNNDNSATVESGEGDAAEGSTKLDEKALIKAKKKAEKEAMMAQRQREEEERQRRREEKLQAIEDAKKLKEEKERLIQEAQAQKAAIEAEKKAQEDAEQARLEALLMQKKQEREARKKAKFEAKIQQDRENLEAIERILQQDSWNQAQQTALEQAVLTYFPSMEKVERWTKIANEVPDKTINQCLHRYKYLKEYFRIQSQLEEVLKERK